MLVEVNCETDFVAKNETFRAFCDDVAKRIASNPNEDLESLRTEQVAKIGENIQVRRFARFKTGEGLEKRSTDLAGDVAAVLGE